MHVEGVSLSPHTESFVSKSVVSLQVVMVTVCPAVAPINLYHLAPPEPVAVPQDAILTGAKPDVLDV